jgi:hypothetical protein
MKDFEQKRLTTSALLGMFAPIPVFEAYNALVDYIFDCLEARRPFVFAEFRVVGFKLLSEIRADIEISGGELITLAHECDEHVTIFESCDSRIGCGSTFL